jgi:hypothetical protein
MRYLDLSYIIPGALLLFALLFAHPPAALAQNSHTLPLFMPASNMAQQGFVRIINHSDQAGTVTIHAIDDSGQEAGPVTLSLEANETKHFNSGNLEQGNSDKGLSGSTGSGQDNWRLKLETNLDIEPLAYIRNTADGFLTSIHDVVQGESMRWHVPIFNPGGNDQQKSQLRLINISDTATEVKIEGLDDDGMAAPGGAVQMTLLANAARLYSALDLETGHSEFEGNLGNGTGKWQLIVSADRPIQVMSLMSTPTGHVTNLSTSTSPSTSTTCETYCDFAPADQAAFDALVVGKKGFVTGDYPGRWDFVSPGHAVHVSGSGGTSQVRYTYEKTGLNLGTLEFRPTVLGCLPFRLAFRSATTGDNRYTCVGESGTGAWRLVEIDP